MTVELDHVFICCAPGAPEARALTELGFIEGSPNRHAGQGTACRRFFFRTSYLELLWVHNPEEAQQEAVRLTGLWERWLRRADDASPFGIVLRPGRGAADMAPPFPAWPYRPAYLPRELFVGVASDVPPGEPGFFWLPFHRDGPPPSEPVGHSLGHTMTGVRIRAREAPTSAAARLAETQGLLTFTSGEGHAIELTLDGGLRGEASDLRPLLPLTLRW